MDDNIEIEIIMCSLASGDVLLTEANRDTVHDPILPLHSATKNGCVKLLVLKLCTKKNQ